MDKCVEVTSKKGWVVQSKNTTPEIKMQITAYKYLEINDETNINHSINK